jgi:hypothetical protein
MTDDPVATLRALAAMYRQWAERSKRYPAYLDCDALAKHIDGVIARSHPGPQDLPGVPWQVNADVRELLAIAKTLGMRP